MVGRVEAMARMAETPLIADGDTGYGGLLNVRHAVQGYERAGAAAIQLEDQDRLRARHLSGRWPAQRRGGAGDGLSADP
jgi:2-methylisocitrate lyase-like PEP mutase family enzyme